MSSRSLVWTMSGMGAAVAALMWCSPHTQQAPSGVEPSSTQQTSTSPAVVDLDSDPLALVRAPAKVVSPPIRDATANMLSELDHERLTILVIDRATRAPLPGMGVQLSSGPLEQYSYTNSMHMSGAVVHTDAKGRAAIDRPNYLRSSSIFAWDPAGHAGSAEQDLDDPPIAVNGDIVLELSPDNDFVLWMCVVDEETNAPLVGAHDVVPIDMNLPSNSPFPSYMSFQAQDGPNGWSDARGLLLISGPMWTRHQIKLVVPEHSTVYVNAEKGHERAENAMIVTTPRVASLHVHVVDRAGLPVRDCRIVLESNSNQQERPRPKTEDAGPRTYWEGRTDESGKALVVNITPHVVVQGRTEGIFNWKKITPLTLEPGERREVEWVASGGVTLRGILLDQADSPIADCDIWLVRTSHERSIYLGEDNEQPARRARTDASGRFAFASAEPGRFLMGPGRSELDGVTHASDGAPLAIILDVKQGEPDPDVVLHADRGLFVSGRVLPPEGTSPLQGLVVAEDRTRGLRKKTAWNADGSFSIGPLMNGQHTITALSSSGYAPSEPVVVDASTQDLKLKLCARTSISGRIVDDQGREIPSSVLLTPLGAGPEKPSVGMRSMDGTFTFAGLAPGRYMLAAQQGMQLAAMDDVEVVLGKNVADVVLRLSPGGLVRIRCTHPQGWNEVTLEQNGVRLVNQKFEGSGRTTIDSPAGRVVLRLRNTETGKQCEHEVDVDVGKITDITIEDEAR